MLQPKARPGYADWLILHAEKVKNTINKMPIYWSYLSKSFLSTPVLSEPEIFD